MKQFYKKICKYNESNSNKIFNNLDARLRKDQGFLSIFGNLCINLFCLIYIKSKRIRHIKMGSFYRKKLREDSDDVQKNYQRVIEQFEEQLRNKEIISFDIFDTLLVRSLLEPRDLFSVIAKEENLENFAKSRVIAEHKARKIFCHFQDVTLDQIYECMHPRYKGKKHKELSTEKRFITANPYIIPLYHSAVKAKKKIIATSDMYLPPDFLNEVLLQNGFENINKIYVSSEAGVTKNTGDLFDFILLDENVKPGQILHIGDNKDADFEVPVSKKIESINCPKITDCIRSVWREIPTDGIDNLKRSIHLGLFSNRIHKSFYEELGYFIGGPIALSYLFFVINEAKSCEIDRIFFTARDGWILKKLYDKHFRNFGSPSSEYVYLNRMVGIKAFLEWCGEPRYLNSLLVNAAKSLPQISVSSSFDKNVQTFNKYQRDLSEWSSDLRCALTKHIMKAAEGANRIAVIDTTTGAFSSLKFLKHSLGERVILGIFTGTYSEDSSGLDYSVFSKYPFSTADTPIVKLLEFLISSPESPVVSFNQNGPEYGSSEGDKQKIYPSIAEGIQHFADDYITRIGLKDEFLYTYEEWAVIAGYFLKNISISESKYFDNILFSSEPDNKSDQEKLRDLFG